MLWLRTDLAKQWQGQDIFSLIQQLTGKVFRNKEGRKTLQFELNNKSYFLKLHQGVGWQEIIKNLLQFRLPVIGAKNEWQAIKFLERHDIDTLKIAAYGERGSNPAKKLSFLITDELADTMSLEDIGHQWRCRPPLFATKIKLIKKLANISRVMHKNGMNHRDYYLCHFLVAKSFADSNTISDDTRLFLIDLHRAQIRKKVPVRWLVKDLSGLLFSAAKVSLTKRDLLRFMMVYSGLPLRELLKQQQEFWIKVAKRAVKMQDK